MVPYNDVLHACASQGLNPQEAYAVVVEDPPHAPMLMGVKGSRSLAEILAYQARKMGGLPHIMSAAAPV